MDDAPWLTPITSDRLTLLPAHPDHVEVVATAAMESAAELARWSKRVPEGRDRAYYVKTVLERAATTTLGTVIQRHAFTRALPATFVASVSIQSWHDPRLQAPAAAAARRVDESPDLEIGYWCRTAKARQGYTSASVSAVVAHAFEHLRARALWMRIGEENVASRRIAERLAFSEVERIRFPASPEWGDAATVLFMRRLA